MFHQQFFVYQLPSEHKLKWKITEGSAWSKFEALFLLNVSHKYLFNVLHRRKEKAIRVYSMFHQQFLVYQLPSEHKLKWEITEGRAWSQFEALVLLKVSH
jgi:hypothetical protein